MILEKITEQARQIKGFSKFPVTVQIAMIYPLISEATELRIPHAMICEAMIEAGSNVQVLYFKAALKVVRDRLKETAKKTPKSESSPLIKKPFNASQSALPAKRLNREELDENAKKFTEGHASSSFIQKLLNEQKNQGVESSSD